MAARTRSEGNSPPHADDHATLDPTEKWWRSVQHETAWHGRRINPSLLHRLHAISLAGDCLGMSRSSRWATGSMQRSEMSTSTMLKRVQRTMPRLGLRVGGKVFLAVAVLVAAMLMVAGVGLVGLGQTHRAATELYQDKVLSSGRTAVLSTALAALAVGSLREVQTTSIGSLDRQDADLDQVRLPRVLTAIDELRDAEEDPRLRAKIDRIRSGVNEYQSIRLTGAYHTTGSDLKTERRNAALAGRTAGLCTRLLSVTEELQSHEVQSANEFQLASARSYRSTRMALAWTVGLSLLLGLLIVVLLVRNLVPRIRGYSRFAAQVAAGQPTTGLTPRGRDELAELGMALNEMVRQRQIATQNHEAQAEFIETMQVTETEAEGQELLQRHLQRSITDSAVSVLRRNNSANRLEAVTGSIRTGPLTTALAGAEPRSCLSLRFARTHSQGGATRPPLLSCQLCAVPESLSTCEPLLVGGEVIGSVLTSHPRPLDDNERNLIKSTVAQAAPMLANLRNLALAEFRANNDSLTGLPNKRATEDTLKRMVAQANRSITPLAALMLDLDHFKQINDRYGHPLGDEVLAAVGAAIRSRLRASDFAGRFGGEEFLILLPETTQDNAMIVAETIRTTIADITIPGVDRAITASLGLAGLLEHAGNATGLLRAADRALYAAKAAGRNQIIILTSQDDDRPQSARTTMTEGVN
jgi:diguanylate cyclase (GGDEF)-like protein